MEIKDIINKYKIIGVISNYQSNIKISGKVKELNIKNIDKAIKMVNLNEDIINKDIKDLSISELWKIELLTKINNEIIIIGNMSNSLIYKDMEFIKRLLIKISNDYNKKIIIIDNNIDSFINLVERIYVIDNKKIIYDTSDYFDNLLYKYINMPKIVEFIKYVNKNKIELNNTVDIYELIKDIYRRVS